MNTKLRQESYNPAKYPDSPTTKSIEGLDKFMENAPKTDKPIIVKRGYGTTFLSNANEGDVLLDKGYVSTSIKPNWSWGGGTGATEIRIPEGSTGVYVAKGSSHPGEMEFLLPRNSYFKVIKKGTPLPKLKK